MLFELAARMGYREVAAAVLLEPIMKMVLHQKKTWEIS
jgi:hypothetical protein